LDWTAAGGNPTSIDELEVLYENDEVAVICTVLIDRTAMA